MDNNQIPKIEIAGMEYIAIQILSDNRGTPSLEFVGDVVQHKQIKPDTGGLGNAPIEDIVLGETNKTEIYEWSFFVQIIPNFVPVLLRKIRNNGIRMLGHVRQELIAPGLREKIYKLHYHRRDTGSVRNDSFSPAILPRVIDES